MFTAKRDALIILVLLLVAAGIWILFSFFSGDALYGEIYLEGNLIKTVPLDKNTVFSLDEAPAVTFEVCDLAVSFKSSDCPDKVCVNSGWLSQAGDFAACLPNRLSLRISGEG